MGIASIMRAVFYICSLACAIFVTREYTANEWEKTVSDIKLTTSKAVEAGLNGILNKERAERDRANSLEVKHYVLTRESEDMRRDNDRLVDELARVRGEGKGGNGADERICKAAGAGSADDKAAGIWISKESARAILDIAAEADIAAIYAGTCHEFVTGLDRNE